MKNLSGQEITERTIKFTMRNMIMEHKEANTSEINCTSLSESTARKLNLYENDVDYTIPERVFEIAVELVG